MTAVSTGGEPLEQLARIRVVARRWGITARCAKRRLVRLDRRLRAEGRTVDAGILVQFASRGPIYVDLTQLQRYLPGVVARMRDGEDAPDPVTPTSDDVGRMRTELAALTSRVEELTALLRVALRVDDE